VLGHALSMSQGRVFKTTSLAPRRLPGHARRDRPYGLLSMLGFAKVKEGGDRGRMRARDGPWAE